MCGEVQLEKILSMAHECKGTTRLSMRKVPLMHLWIYIVPISTLMTKLSTTQNQMQVHKSLMPMCEKYFQQPPRLS